MTEFAGELSGKVALVTGGAGGVGSAVVELLARRGAVVFLNCFHSFSQGRATAARLTGEGLDVRVARGSVSKTEHVKRIVEGIQQSSGRLDILVNNAALGIFGTATSLTDDDFDRTFDVNVKSPLRCVRAVQELMADGGGGAIVNLSSIGSNRVLEDYLAIGLSKSALETMTRYLAVELAPAGIRVNTASGGLLDTPGGRMFPGYAEMATVMQAQTPMGRLGAAREIAEVVGFLVSDRSSWITGQCIVADGGISLPVGRLPSPPAYQEETVPARVEEAAQEGAVEDPVVVVGMGLAVAGASSPQEYWQILNEGPLLFTEAGPDRWQTTAFTPGRREVADKGYQPVSGLIADFAPHPGLAAEDPAGLDFNTLWLRHSLYQALEQTSCLPDDRFTFCVGLTADGSQHLSENQVITSVRQALHGDAGRHLTDVDKEAAEQALRARFPRGAGSAARSLPHTIAADAIRGILPEGTPAHVVDTACSSSLYALDRGVRELRAGRADVAVCGGSHAQRVANMVMFAKLGGLSPTGEIRALDESADGVLFADGAGLVILKRLSRALADEDKILGVISGIGLSADGKGKAINAPATRGQVSAARRALAKSGVPASDIDIVIAHATGTPAGDSAELLGIAEVYAREHPITVVSNKTVIGHTGWAAGVASLIHLLLCLDHDQIPAQHRFTRLPAHVAEQAPLITVPRTVTDWLPAPDPRRPGTPQRARHGAVAGFGFGGTNASVIVSEYAPGLALPTAGGPEMSAEPLVIVGWSAKEPDGATFGDVYPMPAFQQVSLPPPLVRAIDRGQLLAIECMQRLPEEVRRFCQEHRETTGVLVGALGQTHAMSAGLLRAHLDDVTDALTALPAAGMPEFLAGFRRSVDSLLPMLGQDSSPGSMPNVIASRISNYFDLRGFNLLVDGGEAAMLRAFQTAACYLNAGDLDLALVAGMSANVQPAWVSSVMPELSACSSGEVAEGAYLFAVTRESIADQAGLTVLANLEC
jgi:NAD(P)-dependent dehydrogenase (short-subunit alcohol dehydrogenase family)/3-oxoacyl-(acyl-carrier-protein) synthase